MCRRAIEAASLLLLACVATLDVLSRRTQGWMHPKPEEISIDDPVLLRFSSDKILRFEDLPDRYVALEHGSFVLSSDGPVQTATVPAQFDQNGGFHSSTDSSPLRRDERTINGFAFQFERKMSSNGAASDFSRTTYTMRHRTTLSVKLWSLYAPLLAFPAWTMRNLLRRRRNGFCESCGYNLTGNVSGICPECGQKVDGQTASKE